LASRAFGLHGKAALLPGGTGFPAVQLVSGALRVGSLAALAGDGPHLRQVY
jgi:hypothetical protein